MSLPRVHFMVEGVVRSDGVELTLSFPHNIGASQRRKMQEMMEPVTHAFIRDTARALNLPVADMDFRLEKTLDVPPGE